MKYKELPLHIPLVDLSTFEEWQKKFSKNGKVMPNYRTTYDRLSSIRSKTGQDPIHYIVNLSKTQNLNDAEVAIALNLLLERTTEWTAKMVFSLRKQCGILGNDYRSESIEIAQESYIQPTPVQDTVKCYLVSIESLLPDASIPDIRDQEEKLTRLVLTLGFSSLDMFIKELVDLKLGERPIKEILDALYTKHSIPEGKGNRVGYVYIRNKIRILSIIL